MIRKFGGAAGVDIQPAGVDIGFGGGSNIKSIQRGTIVMDSSTKNVTINAVDLVKSIVIIDYNNTGYTSNGICNQAVLLNATTISITGWTGNTVAWQVIEFNNVKSVQRGTASINADVSSLTISVVNLSKSIVVVGGLTSTNSQNASGSNIAVYLTTNNQLTFKRGTGIVGDNTLAWQVIEFN